MPVVPTVIKPITTDEEILEFIHSLNGDAKHDVEICKKYGIPKSVSGMIRRVFGKVTWKKRYLSQDFKDKVIKDYQDGISIKEIAKRNNTTPGGIYSILKLNNVERERWNPWSEIKRMKLVELREKKKMKWEDIARYFGKTIGAVHLQYKYIKGLQQRQIRREKERKGELNVECA